MLRSVAGSEKRQFHTGLALFLCLLAGACTGEAPGPATDSLVAPASDRDCWADPAGLERRAVKAVIDGDTLRLAGGDSLRLVGVNTPEIGRDGRPDEPLAREARAALERLIGPAGAVWLRASQQERDRYSRLLAYAYNEDGDSLSAGLIGQGLGLHVAIAPNLSLADCLENREQAARTQGRGLWGTTYSEPLAVADLAAGEGGFQWIRDRVTRVSFKDNGWWVQLGGRLGLKIAGQAQANFSAKQLRSLQGRWVETRGWVIPMKGGWWMMKVDHPSMLRPQGSDG